MVPQGSVVLKLIRMEGVEFSHPLRRKLNGYTCPAVPKQHKEDIHANREY